MPARPDIRRLIKAVFNREVLIYVIVGGLTTLVNLVVMYLLNQIFGSQDWWFSTAPAVLAAMIFAFFANRIFVFRSHGPLWQEMWKFLSSRILVSLAFEIGGMYLLYNLIGFTDVIHLRPGDEGLQVAKLLTQILVMIGNYVISKFFVFRRESRFSR
ncbi:MAG: GtrA family protein [Saccharofermentanales bacterium]|jgi:putative flippase GtrA|nr:GtrA family protein [Clostridiaceae bacterium]